MNEIYNTPSELLTQLMDGEISAQQTEQLFASLSVDKDLRQEFQEHIAIRESVRNDIEAFTPPVAATNAIFTKLGYSTPTGSNSGSQPKVIPIWSTWARRAVAPAIIGVFAIFGILNYSDLFVSSNNITNNQKNNSIVQNVDKNISLAIPNNSDSKNQKIDLAINKIARVNSNASDELISKKAVNNIDKEDANSKSAFNNIDFKSTPESDIYFSNKSLSDREINLISNSNTMIRNNSVYQSQNGNLNQQLVQPNSSFSNNIANKNYTLYLKGFSDLNTGNSILSPTNTNSFVNLTFGYMLELKNNFSFGAEAGVHSYMKYRTDDNNMISQDQIESSVFWITANCRYDVMDFSVFDVNPYAQLSAGGSTMGFIARSGVGLQYQPMYSSFGFNVGFEYSNIWYSLSPDNAEKVNFTTSNSGIVAGFSYKF